MPLVVGHVGALQEDVLARLEAERRLLQAKLEDLGKWRKEKKSMIRRGKREQ